MTPKEKAEELVNKFYNTIYLDMDYKQAIYSALIAVDTVMDYMTPQTDSKEAFEYWEQVKQEIEAL